MTGVGLAQPNRESEGEGMHAYVMRAVLCGILAMMVAGCASSDGAAPIQVSLASEGDADTLREAGEFWMVWVEGREDVPHPSDAMGMCSIAFSHQVEPSSRSIRHERNQSWQPNEVALLIATDLFERGSDCPQDYALTANQPSKAIVTDAWGQAGLEVSMGDGSVLFRGHHIAPGEVATFVGGADRANAVMRVHAFGAWPQAGLHTDP